MKILPLTIALCTLTLASGAPASGAEQQGADPVLVGRVSFLQGSLLRYIPEKNDWTALVEDAPFGMRDTLYAAEDARAEICLPNSALIRLNGGTQVQLLRLDPDVTEVDIAKGIVRIYNRSATGVIRAATPFGQVVAPARTAVDLYVSDSSVEATCVRGGAFFIHAGGTSKYDLTAGGMSLVAGRGMVSAGDGTGDRQWEQWNSERDRLWEARRASGSTSQKYLPPQLYDEAYALEENGCWEYVPYSGGYYHLWRPVYIHAGWAPFTAGRWTLWYGDHCWIPDEPFGYITHHYGTWVYIDSRRCWFWAPPMVATVYGHPFGLPCVWYPGRVAWIYSDLYVGWIPLMPYETYYCSRYWGPGSLVVADITIADRHHRHRHRHHHDRHAVILGKAHVYGVRNYRAAGLCRRGGELTHHEFRSAPVLDDGIVRVGAGDRGRTAFAPEKSFHKPDNRMLDRIRKNLAAAQRDKKFDAIRIMDKVKQLRPGVVRPRAEPFAQRDDGTRVLSRIADRPRRAVGGTPFGTEAAPRSPPVRDLNFFNRTVERTEVRNPRRPHPAAPVSTGPLSPGGRSGRDTAPKRFFSDGVFTSGGGLHKPGGFGTPGHAFREQAEQARQPAVPRVIRNPHGRGF